MERYAAGRYDVIVLGAGHAGCEAALAAARMGMETLCLTMNLDAVALMACNPSIGGSSKGHLVREVDALGGEMGLAADDATIQSKMLNLGKGPAVHSLRVQADKRRYHERMKRALERCEKLTLRQGEVAEIRVEKGRISGVTTATGAVYAARALVVAAGVYAKSRILIGDYSKESGPSGLFAAERLSDTLNDLGYALRRFKTGTPARVHRASLDYAKMQAQWGDERPKPFSFLHDKVRSPQVPCHLTYTNERTHEIILDNLDRAPMYSGKVEGTGARYCPSIEDKVVRFAHRERHQLFLEPEGLSTDEVYVQGLSTSLPEDVQRAFLRSIEGMERVEIMRPAYAIEYDCIDATTLSLSLQSRSVEGLFFAGQINGSSGYEEAAAQGLMAGINAARAVKEQEPFVLKRSDGYIGVLIDDLVSKGTEEPYRMMTSRAEYRLLLRQDNADQRLTPLGYRAGLAGEERMRRLEEKVRQVEKGKEQLQKGRPMRQTAEALLAERGESFPGQGITWYDLLKRPGLTYAMLRATDPLLADWPEEVAEQLEIQARYEGYIRKQEREVQRFLLMEDREIPRDVDYEGISALRIEARQKLTLHRPANLGQAGRISGVSPADLSVLLVYLEKRRRQAGGDR